MEVFIVKGRGGGNKGGSECVRSKSTGLRTLLLKPEKTDSSSKVSK
jgi:hypothetical protein